MLHCEYTVSVTMETNTVLLPRQQKSKSLKQDYDYMSHHKKSKYIWSSNLYMWPIQKISHGFHYKHTQSATRSIEKQWNCLKSCI